MKSLLKSNLLIFRHNRRPSHLAGVFCFLIVFIVSCSTIRLPGRSSGKGDLVKRSEYQKLAAEDYADQFTSLRDAFLQTPDIKQVKLEPAVLRYLEKLSSEIIAKNEIFFKNLKSARISVINSESPLNLSLPRGEIFLSKGLISKYIKHESMLVSILAYELVRSERLLYPKETIIPTGYMPLERMLMLGRLSLDEKMEVHKWAHHIVERSGYDGEYYLSWLQTQNRNTADFILQVGDANLITREEALFKAHLIKNDSDNNVIKKNSSKEFYTLINTLRDGTI